MLRGSIEDNVLELVDITENLGGLVGTNKRVIIELIDILKDSIASDHRYTECGEDPQEDCLNGTCNCKYAGKCSYSYKLEKRFNELLVKIN
jgi:hypothetical protein